MVPLLGGVERFVEFLHVPLGFSGLNWMGGGGHSLSCGLGMQQIVWESSRMPSASALFVPHFQPWGPAFSKGFLCSHAHLAWVPAPPREAFN